MDGPGRPGGIVSHGCRAQGPQAVAAAIRRGSWMLYLLLAMPFVAALLIALVTRASRRAIGWLAALVPLVGLGMVVAMAPAVMDGEVPRAVLPWLPQVGLMLDIRLDGLAWMFAMMVLLIGALVVMYARYYLSKSDSARRFFAY